MHNDENETLDTNDEVADVELDHALDADDDDDRVPGFAEDIDSFDDDDEVDTDDDDDLDDDDDEDDDSDDDSDDDDFDDYDDDLDDATADDIDCVVALYREDGEPVGVTMSLDLANDLDELITQLRRLPGDAGALGVVSIAGEFYVLVRVRGRVVQVLLSDNGAANYWPIARDVVEYLGEDVPDEDDDPELLGDGDILADLGVTEFELEQLADESDDDNSDEQVAHIAQKVGFGPQFTRAAASQNL